MIIFPESIARFDPEDMFRCISDFPAQIEEAVQIGWQAQLGTLKAPFSSVVVTGMGGSAIGGDLLRSYLSQEVDVPFLVSRSYLLPGFIGKSTLVVVSSYSGNTEETLSAYQCARKKHSRILCVTAGGRVLRLAEKNGHSVIRVVPGLQPRAALGYSFFPLLVSLTRIGLIKNKDRDISETIDRLWILSRQLRNYRSPRNKAVRIARALHGKLPVIYSSVDYFDAVNVRWRGQISENAKQLAYGHVLPEMNHNEIVGWNVDHALMKRTVAVFLKDRGVQERVRLREEITRSIVRRHAADALEVWSEGTSLLARIFSLVYLGDWVSYYLAILNKRNPTPVKVIEELKARLSKS
jgi:glucose/mannose-6-phosphate isomerase